MEQPTSKYAELVTVLSVLLMVEYASGAYDFWDLLIGFVAFFIGINYIPESISSKDLLFKVLTSALITLGYLCFASSIIGFWLFMMDEIIDEEVSAITQYKTEMWRVIVFSISTFITYIFVYKILKIKRDTTELK